MSSAWLSRSVVEAPFLPKDGVQRLGRALWLYLHLLRIANHRGLALRTWDRLEEELVVPKRTVELWLARLAEAKLVLIESPAPFLVIRLSFWSDHDDSNGENRGQPSSLGGHSHSEVPVSSSKQQAAAAFKQTGEGGAGEGEALVAEVAQVLDGADADEVRSLVAEFPNPVVLKAMIRVKTTPSSQIRKSKLALFRYLLAKFAANPHAH